jgi:hypothetical protein
VRLFPDRSGELRRRFVLLSPRRSHSGIFCDSAVDASLHRKLLADAQKLRGSVYLEIGAIEHTQLSADGRHLQPDDERSWHLLTLDERGRVAACTRYLSHPDGVSYSDLTVSHSALATSESWGPRFRKAIEAELALARKRRWSYVEMGGWVISKKMRCTSEAVRMVLAAYGLAQLMGGALGIATVTQHGSCPILRRIGGESLLSRGVEMPPYYEPQYKFEMEILRFDSSRPNSRYSAWVDDCRAYLQTVPVICAKPAVKPLEEVRIGAADSFVGGGRSSPQTTSDEPAWEQSTGVA